MSDYPLPYDTALNMLSNGAPLVISISGGKDSDAMTYHLIEEKKRRGWTGEIYLVHADLGRAEWGITPRYVDQFAAKLNLPLAIVRHSYGDLIAGIWRRWEKRPGTCPFPSSAARYCTSDWKRSPISVWIRNKFPEGEVVCAMGLRAEESRARARRPEVEQRGDCISKKRFVVNWNPIHKWTRKNVLEDTLGCDDRYLANARKDVEAIQETYRKMRAHGHSQYDETPQETAFRLYGRVIHPAYILGNERLSCALCVLGSFNDLLNGAIHNPDAYRELCRIEAVTGFSFRDKFWLSELKPELLSEEILAAIKSHKEARTA